MLLQRVRLCLVAFQLVPPQLAPTLFLQDKGTLLRAREKKKTEIISRLLIKLDLTASSILQSASIFSGFYSRFNSLIIDPKEGSHEEMLI